MSHSTCHSLLSSFLLLLCSLQDHFPSSETSPLGFRPHEGQRDLQGNPFLCSHREEVVGGRQLEAAASPASSWAPSPAGSPLLTCLGGSYFGLLCLGLSHPLPLPPLALSPSLEKTRRNRKTNSTQSGLEKNKPSINKKH